MIDKEEIKKEINYNCKFIKDMNDNNTEIVTINYKKLMSILDKYKEEPDYKAMYEKEIDKPCEEYLEMMCKYCKTNYKAMWEELKSKYKKVNQEDIETFGKMLNSCLAEVTLKVMQDLEKKHNIVEVEE